MTGDKQRRGQLVARRRQLHGLSVLALSKESGIARPTITNVEAGAGSPDSLLRVEGYLDKLDTEKELDTKALAAEGEVSQSLEPGVIRFTIRGPGTPWELETEAHVENLGELTKAVEEILRNMPRGD